MRAEAIRLWQPEGGRAPRILVVNTLRLGDVLLSTVIARSLKSHFPAAQVDALVLQGCEPMLEGNPDYAQVWALPHRAGLGGRWRELGALWKHYDLALSPVSSDRARSYCFMAGHKSVGFVNLHTGWLSQRLLNHGISFDTWQGHMVRQVLRLLEPLEIPGVATVIPPRTAQPLPQPWFLPQRYVVVHPYPKFTYKQWSQESWIDLINFIRSCGLQVVLTGSPLQAECAFNRQIAQKTGALDASGHLSLAHTTQLIERSILYLGTDTSITHLAAATGVLTVALFGPTNPCQWGPWPIGQNAEQDPWSEVGSGRVGNVVMIQGEATCVPCQQEGCERHPSSYSRCLQTLSPQRVEQVVESLLAEA